MSASDHHGDPVDRTDEWDRMRAEHLRPKDARPPSTARTTTSGPDRGRRDRDGS